jgi:hypothetical protein
MTATEPNTVREAAVETVNEIITDIGQADTDREALLDRVNEEADALFGRLVRYGRIDRYDVDDLIATAGPCALILQVAKEDAYVADDAGLWEGLTYGVLAAVAYHSLENLIHAELERRGFDINADFPFRVEADE